MEKEIYQFTSVKDWEYEARKRIEQRFLTSCMRVRNWDISDKDFYVISFAKSPYVYKVIIYGSVQRAWIWWVSGDFVWVNVGLGGRKKPRMKPRMK